MAQLISLDTGIQEFQINGGVLRFNPSDIALYHRFCEIAEALPELEKEFEAKAKELDTQADEFSGVSQGMKLLCEFDAKLKERLCYAFGEADWNAILGGVNLLSVGSNGERVITNVLQALQPILEEGVEAHLKAKAGGAVQAAQKNRAQRRAEQ